MNTLHTTPETTTAIASANTGRRWFAGIAALGGVALLSTAAAAQGLGHGGHGGRGRNPEEMAKHMQARINFLITAVDGTPEQKERLLALHKTAMTELQPVRAQLRKARKDGMALLSEATINRSAVEQLRVSQIQLGDTLSKRMTQLMIEAAEVLNPAQRTKLADLMKQRGDRPGRNWGGSKG
ncbi:MAG: Spy/CpxP family protein refolding chaperone [Burkholderiales bacterium]